MSNTIELKKSYKQTPISNGVLGMVLLVITEIMFFAGLISAYLVNRAGAINWPPPDQPRLPIEMTAINTFILILSGIFFIVLVSRFNKEKKAGIWLFLSILAGLTFVGIQGIEWVNMIGFGLTSTSSIYGAFFYVIIGMHAFHVLIGIGFLLYLAFVMWKSDDRGRIFRSMQAVSIFWYFVILIWPILYFLVYLY